MSFFASLLAAFLPMTAYLILLWRFDKYEREPLSKIVKHFLWGAAGAVLLGILISSLFNFSAKWIIGENAVSALMSAVLVAPVVEESVKAVYLLRSSKNNYFDNITDGIIYGAAIGLGFGMTENLLYFTFYDTTIEQWISVVMIRTFFSAVMHAIATATVGAFIAKAKFNYSSSKINLISAGLLIAMMFHSAWNFLLSADYTYYIAFIFMLILIATFFIVLNNSLINERNLILSELKEEQDILNLRYDKISKRILLSDNIVLKGSEEKSYVDFATKLAFRKLQARNSTGLQKEFYLNDIEKIKLKLNELKKDFDSRR